MFTGLVEEVGIVKEVIKKGDGLTILISASQILTDAYIGASIAVNGACQTMENFSKTEFQIFSIPETLAATNFSHFEKGSVVNLERPLRPTDRIAGHIVQGHVETVAEVDSISKSENYWDVYIAFKSANVILKGSICLDGISLTVQEITKTGFKVQIIPETIRKTNIKNWQKGYRLNIETDYLLHALEQIVRYHKENHLY